MVRAMRIFWLPYFLLLFVQKVAIPFYFFVLSAFTAPGDTSDLIKEVNRVMENVSGNIALDFVLLAIGTVGLIATTGWGNWRVALHRYLSKPRLERLVDDARRVSEDIANTISQERVERDRQFEMQWQSDHPGWRYYPSQDNRYLGSGLID